MRLRLVVLVLALAAFLAGCAGANPLTAPPTATATETETDEASGLPVVDVADLPPQARETIELIDAGGPFPYRQDDQTFGNREGLLPKERNGFYREYTVPTPGESDRGARRIVAGSDDVLYYTDDHYQSFRRIRR
jgi:ribonuclease T1